MKAFLLARVSTDDQKDALPAQTYRLTEYAKRMNYEFDLTEIKESAYKDTRNEFKSIVDRIKDCKEKVIVVFDKIDRYTRDSSSEQVRILQTFTAPERSSFTSLQITFISTKARRRRICSAWGWVSWLRSTIRTLSVTT